MSAVLAETRPVVEKASWEHYVGFLADTGGHPYAIQVTTFRWDDAASRHVALLDLATKERKVFCAPVPLDAAASVGTFENDDFRIEWNFVHGGHRILHGKDGTVLRYGIECSHESNPSVTAHVTIGKELHQRRDLTGSCWRDAEELPVTALRGWDWFCARLETGESLMLYHPRDAEPWGVLIAADGTTTSLVAADFSVEPVDAYLSAESGRLYPCLWNLQVRGRHDLACVIRPVVLDQEVIDPEFAPYWEGACELMNDRGPLGEGFFEMAGYPFASEAQMGLRWARGDRDAAQFMALLARGSQLADDFVDEETPRDERGKTMVEMLDSALREIPQNAFYQKHREALTPLMSIPLIYWEASNDWAKSKVRTSRIFAFVMREALEMVVVGVALITGGRDWARRVVREMHTYYHVLDEEPFERWEAEHGV